MKLNFYDILFFCFYDVMSRAGNKDPNDDKFDGLIGGAILLSIVPAFLLFDIYIILVYLKVCPFEITQTNVILALIILMCFNVVRFSIKKRYLNIINAFYLLTRRKRRQNRYISLLFVMILVIVFIALVYLNAKYKLLGPTACIINCLASGC
jgi:hypothetical protein